MRGLVPFVIGGEGCGTLSLEFDGGVGGKELS